MWSSQYTCTVIPISAVKKLQHEGQDEKRPKKPLKRPAGTNTAYTIFRQRKRPPAGNIFRKKIEKRLQKTFILFIHSSEKPSDAWWPWLTWLKCGVVIKTGKKGQNWVVRRATKEESSKKVIFFAVSVPKNHFQFQNTDVLCRRHSNLDWFYEGTDTTKKGDF